MLFAVFGEGFELASDGAILFEAATVTQIGVYDGAWRDGGGRDDVGGQRIGSTDRFAKRISGWGRIRKALLFLR